MRSLNLTYHVIAMGQMPSSPQEGKEKAECSHKIDFVLFVLDKIGSWLLRKAYSKMPQLIVLVLSNSFSSQMREVKNTSNSLQTTLMTFSLTSPLLSL